MITGKVTDELVALVTKQVQDHGIVVWYDAESVYEELLDQIEWQETTILRFTGSFFELRHRMEPYLKFVDEGGQILDDTQTAPRLVVYVTLDQAATEHALIEGELAGVVMQPGASPWQRNTRLKVLAERVFLRISPERAGEIGAEVEAGRRSLAELNWLAEQTGELGAVKLIFGTTAIAEVVLAFSSTEKLDPSIIEKQALSEMSRLCQIELGLEIRPDQPVGQARHELCRSLLLAELALMVEAAGGDPERFAAIGIPEAPRQRQKLLDVCQQWRNRLDLREAYAKAADKVQKEAQVMGLGLEAPNLKEAETFSFIESLLLEWAEATVLEGDIALVLELARKRKSSFWSRHEPELQIRWTLLEIAAQFFQVAERVKKEMSTIGRDASAMISAYTMGVTTSRTAEPLPWYELDQSHRHLEHRYAMLEQKTVGAQAPMEDVIKRSRQRYNAVVSEWAERLTEDGPVPEITDPGLIRQQDIFRQHVRPHIREVKTAYILADALRYEMGWELVEGLGEDYFFDMHTGLAQLPTITEVGMAALMPDADKGMELVDVGGGRVGIRIGTALLKDRSSRVKHFQESTQGTTLVLKLDDLMRLPKKRREAIAEANLILVTSQEIDRRGEEMEDEAEARRFMDEVLEKLRQGIRRLASLGVRRIVVAADHGHLFVEQLEQAMKIDPPGGQTVDLHPRTWIGRGGTETSGVLRSKAGPLGLAGDLELAFPRGLACFKTRGGSRGYFHGGLSLQEWLIPLAIITVRDAQVPEMGTASVTLTLAKPKISTRFFSAEVRYIVAGLFGAETKRVRVVVRAGRSDVGTAAMAAYGFEEGTQEIVLEKDKPNAITMMLTAEIDSPTVSLHVLDATTQVEMAAVKNIPVEISI